MTPPVVLTIAGSDSGGGAGIQADLKSISARGGFATTVITALTAQNTQRVAGVFVTPVDFVAAQLDAVLDDFDVRAVKTGMLADRAIVELVAQRAEAGDLPNLVVDPVMVASSGDRLLAADAEQAYLDQLIPLARVVTPNLREAQVLVGRELLTVDDMRRAAAELRDRGPEVVVVKGGHPPAELANLAEHFATDVVVSPGGTQDLEGPWIPSVNIHGTGCSFASALATGLAFGLDPVDAAIEAKQYVARAIAGAVEWRLGSGQGPIDHFAGARTT